MRRRQQLESGKGYEDRVLRLSMSGDLMCFYTFEGGGELQSEVSN